MSKLNGNGRWIITSAVAIVAVCLTVAGVIMAAGGKLAKVETNEKNIEKNIVQIASNTDRLTYCEKVDAGREKDIEYIKEQLQQINAQNTQVLEYLRTSNNR